MSAHQQRQYPCAHRPSLRLGITARNMALAKDALGNMPSECSINALFPAQVSKGVSEVASPNLAQPGRPCLIAPAVKPGLGLVGLQRGLLHNVRRIRLPL